VREVGKTFFPGPCRAERQAAGSDRDKSHGQQKELLGNRKEGESKEDAPGIGRRQGRKNKGKKSVRGGGTRRAAKHRNCGPVF